MSCRFFAACALWLLGYPEQARKRALETVDIARRINHPFTLAYAYGTAALAHQLRRDIAQVSATATAGIVISRQQGFPHFEGFAEAMSGWALVQEGQIEDGIKHLSQGANGWASQGSDLWRPYWLALLAEAYQKGGQAREATDTLTEAAKIAARTDETFYLAELHRLKAEFRLRDDFQTATFAADQPPAVHAKYAEAEAGLRQAIETARLQDAKSLELRAVTSLARLFRQLGRHDEARRNLTEIYGWFTEGFNTPDLREAKALLDQLSS
jgi:predicted ATPase